MSNPNPFAVVCSTPNALAQTCGGAGVNFPFVSPPPFAAGFAPGVGAVAPPVLFIPDTEFGPVYWQGGIPPAAPPYVTTSGPLDLIVSNVGIDTNLVDSDFIINVSGVYELEFQVNLGNVDGNYIVSSVINDVTATPIGFVTPPTTGGTDQVEGRRYQLLAAGDRVHFRVTSTDGAFLISANFKINLVPD